jgi:putative drug exporter of the RND superfamily
MERLLERWGRIVARVPLLVVAAWIVLVIAALHFGPALDSVAAKQNVQSLPSSAPSMRAAQLYATKFATGQQSQQQETDVLVLTDPQGISAADVALAQQIAAWLTDPATRPAHLLRVAGPTTGGPAGAFESADGKALRLLVTWDTTNGAALQASVSAVDTYLAGHHMPQGSTLGLTGSAPIYRDLSSSVFSTSSSGSGSAAAPAAAGSLVGLLIILVVLGLVYRSPLAVLVPLASIGLALALAIPAIAWFGQTFGVPVASFSLQYVAFVMLGAGTNYGVFMLSRYREELRRAPYSDRVSRHKALATTLGRVGEAILSSGSIVIAATAIMGLAQLDLLRVTGPAVAVGVACLLLAGLTLLPALMALCGRALFWPARPRAGSLAGREVPTRGAWVAIGRGVTRRPALVAAAAVVVLAPLALSALAIAPSFDDLQTLPKSAPSVQAFQAYQQHFPETAQIDVFVSDPGHDLRQSQYAGALASLAMALQGVAHVTQVGAPSRATADSAGQTFATDGSAAQITLGLDVDPSSQAARDAVNAAYAVAANAMRGTALGGSAILLGGQSAQVRDEAIQLGSDFRLVLALVSLVILAILALLVRSLTAPLYLLATIALSTGTAIGLTNLVYHDLLGQPLFNIVPVFAFVFLVALGQDFNILTMSRIREEVRRLGRRSGIAAAVALTGGVVSSCGLVMAASFSRLLSNPVLEVSELGFALVAGILIDTFVVRPLLVPALAALLGRANWVWTFRRRTGSWGASRTKAPSSRPTRACRDLAPPAQGSASGAPLDQV